MTTRTVMAALLGFLAGAGGSYIRLDRGAPDGPTPTELASDPTIVAASPPQLEPLVTGALDADARAGIARAVAETSEPDALLADFASRPASPERSFVLMTIVARIAERDPHAALERLGERFLDPRTARELGLVVLELSPPDAASIDAIIEALPQIDAERFRREAIAQLALDTPAQAVAIALGVDDEGRQRALLSEAALAWLARDAEAALAHARTIADGEQRLGYETALLTELAKRDRTAVLAYATDAYGVAGGERERLLTAVVERLSREAPAAGLALSQELGERQAGRWGQVSAAWLARTDPAAAMRHAERSSRNSFDQQAFTIARVLGEQDADGALEWLQSLDPTPERLAQGVLEGIARVDPLRAIDLGEELGVVGRLSGIDAMQSSAALVADRVLAVEDAATREQWLRTLLLGWNWVDQAAALDWVIANAASVSTQIVDDVGQQHGRRDPTAAMLETFRLPADVQEAWVRGVVRGHMMDDPIASLGWVGQLRGQPTYELAAATIIEAGVWQDATPVVPVFETLSAARQTQVAQRLARTWARDNLQAARTWVVGLAEGQVRDEALTGLIDALGPDALDQGLYAQLSTDTARENAASVVVQRLAYTDPAQARRLIDTYVTDPEKREQAEALLSAAAR